MRGAETSSGRAARDWSGGRGGEEEEGGGIRAVTDGIALTDFNASSLFRPLSLSLSCAYALLLVRRESRFKRSHSAAEIEPTEERGRRTRRERERGPLSRKSVDRLSSGKKKKKKKKTLPFTHFNVVERERKKQKAKKRNSSFFFSLLFTLSSPNSRAAAAAAAGALRE